MAPSAPSGLSSAGSVLVVAVLLELSLHTVWTTPSSNARPVSSPRLKPPAAAPFEVPSLTRKFVDQVAPPSVLNAAKYCTSSLSAASLRASYQDTARLPLDWSTSSHEKNWLATPASSFTRTSLTDVPSA